MRFSLAALAFLFGTVVAVDAQSLSRFEGNYSGEAKVEWDTLSAENPAKAQFREKSGSTRAIVKIDDIGGNQDVRISMKLFKDGTCQLLVKVDDLEVEAGGTYSIPTKKRIEFVVSKEIAGTTISGTGAIKSPSNQKLKMTGRLSGTIVGIDSSVDFSFTGKESE